MTGVPFVVYGIAGSLRRESWNRRLLDAVARLAPDGVRVQQCDYLAEIPLLNEDHLHPEPEPVARLRAEVAGADALMIATPEYNGGAPGVLKNVLDWLSLPLGNSVLQEMPVALMGASIGRLGTARSQWDLRKTFIYSRSPVTPSPEILLSYAADHFDDAGNLVEPDIIGRVELIYRTLQAYARIGEMVEVVAQ